MSPILPGAPWLIAHKSMLGVTRPNKITLNGQDYVPRKTRMERCLLQSEAGGSHLTHLTDIAATQEG